MHLVNVKNKQSSTTHGLEVREVVRHMFKRCRFIIGLKRGKRPEFHGAGLAYRGRGRLLHNKVVITGFRMMYSSVPEDIIIDPETLESSIDKHFQFSQ